MTVENKYPKGSFNKIAIIGEAPGKSEEEQGEPFVGYSGRFLRNLLSRAGINANDCYIGNIAQEKPPGNIIERFQWNGWEIQDGLEVLKNDMQDLRPNVCLLLGNVPLKACLDPTSIHPLSGGRYKYSVSNWRGTLVSGSYDGPFGGIKCIASYHPAAVLRQYSWAPILQFDIKKLAREKSTPDIVLPHRNADIYLDVSCIVAHLREIALRKIPIAIDIEGGIGTMSCISVATLDSYAFIIPFAKLDGSSYWDNPLDEMLIWRELCNVLNDPSVPKILQNSLYDRFVLQYSYGIPVRGVSDDTMLKHWELYCELEKSLGFQASIYTNEPYYKFERKLGDRDTLYRYCCKDSMVTLEISNKLNDLLVEPRSIEHYKFNMDLLNPLLYMELRGIKYDSEKAKKRQHDLMQEMFEHQHDMNVAAGYDLSKFTRSELDIMLRKTCCYKRDPSTPKKDQVESFARALVLLERPGELPKSSLGELAITLKHGLNVNSTKFRDYLYGECNLPLQTNKEGRPTADYEALLKLKRRTKPDSRERTIVSNAISIRNLGTRSGMLGISADKDGRVRCGYNIVGTETGRLTSYTSPTGSGYNLQTIPSYDRDLFVADNGSLFFQCDLSGADGWTVAAHCKALGDPTMFDDLTSNIKPAKVTALVRRHGPDVLRLGRDELRERCGEVAKEDWDYFACKIAQHGTCYLMGPLTLARNIFEKSEGEVILTSGQVRELQNIFKIRYRVQRWHDNTSRKLSVKPVIVAASGHRRVFFGRKQEILGEALAYEPQANTTYATNLACRNLWHDPTNRRPDGSLRVEPLHQVHDALCGQFREEDTDYAVASLKRWFNNPITIAGIQVTIPFEGGYGRSWGELKNQI